MSVVPIETARARRFKPAEARELAAAAGLRTTERDAFQLLIRLSHGGRTVERRRAWLADQLGVTPRTVRRVVASLEARGLLEVTHGTGRTWSTFRVVFEALNVEVSGANPAVHPTESVSPQGGQIVTSGGTNCHPRGDRTTPQGGQNVTPLRTRDVRGARALLVTNSKDSPLPHTDDGAGAPGGPSPIASDGAPFLEATSNNSHDDGPELAGEVERCEHGRTVRQGCRRCGTDSRSQAAKARREAAAAERAAALEAARARADEAAQAKPPPPDWRPARSSRPSVDLAKRATPPSPPNTPPTGEDPQP